jgi:hypothetical protein
MALLTSAIGYVADSIARIIEGKTEDYYGDPVMILNGIRQLLDAHPAVLKAKKLDELGDYGLSPLHLLVYYGLWDCAELLLARGAEPDTQSKRTFQPSGGEDGTIEESWTVWDVLANAKGFYYITAEMFEVFDFYVLLKMVRRDTIAILSYEMYHYDEMYEMYETTPRVLSLRMKQGFSWTNELQEGNFWFTKGHATTESDDISFMDMHGSRGLGKQLTWIHVPFTNVSSHGSSLLLH